MATSHVLPRGLVDRHAVVRLRGIQQTRLAAATIPDDQIKLRMQRRFALGELREVLQANPVYPHGDKDRRR
jgi:hypothetical protein